MAPSQSAPQSMLFPKPRYPTNSPRAMFKQNTVHEKLLSQEVKNLREEILNTTELHQIEMEEQEKYLRDEFSRTIRDEALTLTNYYELRLEEADVTLKNTQATLKNQQRKVDRATTRCRQLEEEVSSLSARLEETRGSMEEQSKNYASQS